MNAKKILKTSLLTFACTCVIANSSGAYSSQAIRYYNEGVENVKQENYNQAIDNFKQAIYQDKTFKDAYFNLGAIYKKTGDVVNAKDIFATILRMDPYDDEAVYIYAQLFFETEDYQNALFYLNTINSFSQRYDYAQKLITQINQIFSEKELAKKQAKYSWKNKTFKDFSTPAGIAADSSGNVYVANYKDNVVEKISASDGKKQIISDENIEGPLGIATDSKDNLYVAGYVSGKIVQITPDGTSKVVIDEIHRPYYLSIKDDILYVTEQETNTVKMLNLWK